jgi:Zn-dependent peptidase ImmA (M78 family)
VIIRGFKTRCENISNNIRKELKLKTTDPLDPGAVAAHFGVLLYKPIDVPGLSEKSLQVLLERQKHSWSAVTISLDRADMIIYNPNHSRARQSSDIMHELAHIICGHDASKVIVSQNGNYAIRSYNQAQEEEANWLSGCLLLPREALISIKRTGISDEEARYNYGVSQDLLTFRLNVTGVNCQFRSRRRSR